MNEIKKRNIIENLNIEKKWNFNLYSILKLIFVKVNKNIGNNSMYIIKNLKGRVFSGLFPPLYKPKFVIPEGSYTVCVFSDHDAAEEVIKVCDEECLIISLIEQ